MSLLRVAPGILHLVNHMDESVSINADHIRPITQISSKKSKINLMGTDFPMFPHESIKHADLVAAWENAMDKKYNR